ncbi:MAG TPA: DUF4012 domain-containing protein [Actinomycetota bacterium]|nr:DUF4012 domain-containing protein [Actinomycetota bacterium]
MLRGRWLAAGILAVAGIGTAFFGYLAIEQATKVRTELTASRQLLSRAGGLAAGSLPERLALVDQAALHARTARLELSRGPLGVLTVVPILGRDARVARAVADSAGETVAASREAATALEPLQRRPPSAGTIQQASTALLRLHDTLETGLQRVRRTKPLIATRGARDQFLATGGPASTTALRAGEGLNLAAGLWGPSGSTRYFLAFQNPAELRGTGGLIGEYGVLEASPGGPRLTRVSSYDELDASLKAKGGIKLLTHLQRRYDEFPIGSAFWAVNVPADLPTVGRMIVSMYQQATGTRVDGVITMDPLALAEILRVSGPISVGGTSLSGDNVVDQTLVQAYVRYERDNPARRRYLQRIAEETLAAFRQALAIRPAELVRGLAVAAKGRHLQAYSSDPDGQRALMDLGIAGSAAAPAHGDYLMPVSVNSGANKLDAFLHRTIRYRVMLQPDGTAKATASVTLRNDGPSSGLPRYVIGPSSPRHRAGQNHQIQTVYVAGAYGFTSATVNGRRAAASSQAEFGGLALSQVVDIPSQSSVTVSYALVRADALQRLPGKRLRYQLVLRPQATVWPDQVEVSISPPPGWTSAGSPGGLRMNGSAATWSGPLDQERVLAVDLVPPD